MANQEQVDRLKRSVEEWNQWRNDNPYVQIELNNSDLRLVNLRLANLERANLHYADLEGAILDHANLEGAILDHANFSFARLDHVKLSYARLFFAKLNSINLIEAELKEANLHGVTLDHANLERAELTQVNLYRSNLLETNFYGAELKGVNLTEANLTGANLTDANLTDADLTQCQLSCSSLESATLTGACIKDWHINSKTNFDNAICEYIYKQYKTEFSYKIYTDRHPSDPNKVLKQGDLARLVQSSLDTIDLIFSDGIDWNAFLNSFQGVKFETRDRELSIQAIEKKNDGSFVVRVNTPPRTDKGKIEKAFFMKYKKALKTQTEKYKKLIETKEKDIDYYRNNNTQLLNIVQTMAEKESSIKNTFNNTTFGGGFANKDYIGDVTNYNFSPGKQKTLAEATKEIQDLLQQLERYPTDTTTQQMRVATEAIDRIENDRDWKQRLVSAGKNGGIEFLKKSFDNPVGALIMGAIEGWINDEMS